MIPQDLIPNEGIGAYQQAAGAMELLLDEAYLRLKDKLSDHTHPEGGLMLLQEAMRHTPIQDVPTGTTLRDYVAEYITRKETRPCEDSASSPS